MPLHKGIISPANLFFLLPLGQQRHDHDHIQALLQGTDHDQVRNVEPVILFLSGAGHDPPADVVVDGGAGDHVLLLQLRRHIIQVPLQQIHHLFHIQAEIGYILPGRQPKPDEIFFPPPEFAGNERFIICHGAAPFHHTVYYSAILL